MSTLSASTGPRAVIERQLDALSPRDRKLLVGLVLGFVFVLTGGFWWVLHHALEDKASRVRDAKEKLEHVQKLDEEVAAAAQTIAAQEDRLKQYAHQPVTAFIEDLAK